MVKQSETYRLGTALLVYFLLITVIVTLLPFRFQMPRVMDIRVHTNVPDFILNVFLFVPLGFLFQLSRRKNTPLRTSDVLLFGVLFSCAIESAQLFLVGRYTSVIDVFSNGMGAWMGAKGYLLLRRRLQHQTVGLMALELPLMNLVYLLVPLLWLSGMATGRELNRLWLLLINGFVGAVVLVEVYRHRLKHRLRVSSTALALGVMLWFLMANLPALVNFPLRVFLFAVVIGWVVFDRAGRPIPELSIDRRFEIPTLQKIMPLYAGYLVLLVYWPLSGSGFRWDWMLSPGMFADDPPLPVVSRLVEYLAASTLLGYMIAEWRGRVQRKSYRAFIRQYGFVAGILLFLEILRGIHPLHAASLGRFLMAATAGIYGSAIYRLQIRTIRKILAAKQSDFPGNPILQKK